MTENNIPGSQVAEKKESRALMTAMLVVTVGIIAIAIIGFCFLKKPAELIEGQADATSVRISGKLPGRVVELYVKEGDNVKAGDTLVHIHSSLAEARLFQAQAMEDAAAAQNRKIDRGTRSQVVATAQQLLAQATAARTIAQKTYERMENLYKERVVSEQRRDEAKAAYDAAVAQRDAAASQLSLAKAGAQSEDKQSAAAMVEGAKSGVHQVNALLEDSYLTAPFDGTIDEVYPEVGELVAMGAPIMSLLRTDDRFITFNIREELLPDFKQGTRLKVAVPGLGRDDVEIEVYYVRDMGTYATWRSTKSTGSYDSRTFQIKARPTEKVQGLRPGMSVLFHHDVEK